MSQIIYNVTLNVSEDVHDDWLAWMKEIHIPEILQTKLFTRAALLRVHAYEQGGTTYAVQYHLSSMDDYERYLKDFAPALREKMTSAFGDGVHAFRTMLEVLETFEVGEST